MTQVQTMTNPELNRALAELMGKWIGDCCGDPAASLEVQTAAIDKDYKAYIHNLNTVIYEEEEGEDDGEYSAVSVEVTAAMLTASPRERAEAAYITLSSKQ